MFCMHILRKCSDAYRHTEVSHYLTTGFNFHSFSIWEGLTRQNIYMNIFQSNLNSDLSESSWRSGPALVQDIFGQVLAEVHEERVAHIIQEILVLWTALLVTVDEAFDEPDGETRKELESSKTSNIKFLHSNPKRNIRMKQHPYIFFLKELIGTFIAFRM